MKRIDGENSSLFHAWLRTASGDAGQHPSWNLSVECLWMTTSPRGFRSILVENGQDVECPHPIQVI